VPASFYFAATKLGAIAARYQNSRNSGAEPRVVDITQKYTSWKVACQMDCRLRIQILGLPRTDGTPGILTGDELLAVQPPLPVLDNYGD